MANLTQLLSGKEPPHTLEAFREALAPLRPEEGVLPQEGGVALRLEAWRPYPFELGFLPGDRPLFLRLQVEGNPFTLVRGTPPRFLFRLGFLPALQILFAYAPALEALGLGERWRIRALKGLLFRWGEKRSLLFRLGRRYHAIKRKWGFLFSHWEVDPYKGKVSWRESSLEALFFFLHQEAREGRYPLPVPPVVLSHLLSLALEKGLKPTEVGRSMGILREVSRLLLQAWQGLPPLPKGVLPPFLPDGRKLPPFLHEGPHSPPSPEEDPSLAHASYWDLLLLDLSLELPLDLLPYAPPPIRYGGKLYYYAPGWWALEDEER
ncbi:hypothetical protein [Thermus sp.]|uniref:hypothetical protein n=1 Tax=Thermus sp. TaxID=275 RepID=UPI002614600C|nr:hypothetical protein [Thermus sp.]MCX7849658.1 hypothetical protein [Thermus sp.]